MVVKKKRKMPSKKKRGSTKGSKIRCSVCGELGHNARSCKTAKPKPSKISKTTKPKDGKKSSESAKVEVHPPPQGGKVPPTSERGSPIPPPEADLAPVGRGVIVPVPKKGPPPPPAPPGAPLDTPVRIRARSKEEEAFWTATTKALGPKAIAEAGNLSLDLNYISTGNFGLDVAMFQGIPQGRIVFFIGEPKSAKTGSCINTAASYQRNHCSECFQVVCSCKKRDVPDVLLIDAEHRHDRMLYWWRDHGVNLDCLRVQEPPSGQDVVDLVDHCIREAPQSKTGLIIVDSLAHVVSKEELAKATQDGPTIGRNAMLLNSAWRKWTSALNSLGIDNPRKPTILCINQLRHKVGVTWGSPEVQPGGKGLEFASSITVRFQKSLSAYVVWERAKEAERKKGIEGRWVAKEKKSKGYSPTWGDQTPDFEVIKYRVIASGTCPRGRFGEFNYWLKSAHGHRCGDPDNGLQLWNYAKRYNLVKGGGSAPKTMEIPMGPPPKYPDPPFILNPGVKTLAGLQDAFRASEEAKRYAWGYLMGMLC